MRKAASACNPPPAGGGTDRSCAAAELDRGDFTSTGSRAGQLRRSASRRRATLYPLHGCAVSARFLGIEPLEPIQRGGGGEPGRVVGGGGEICLRHGKLGGDGGRI